MSHCSASRRTGLKLAAPTVRAIRVGLLLCLTINPFISFAANADGPAEGEKIYDKSCAKCHNAGMGSFFTGAPKIGVGAWKERLAAAGSVDGLVASAAKGKGKMPAQGGASGLSDADLKAAIEYILGKSGQ